MTTNGKAFPYSEANIKATFGFARKLVHAKDAQEFLQLQRDFAKTQIETLQEQAKELSAVVQKAITGMKSTPSWPPSSWQAKQDAQVFF